MGGPELPPQSTQTPRHSEVEEGPARFRGPSTAAVALDGSGRERCWVPMPCATNPDPCSTAATSSTCCKARRGEPDPLHILPVHQRRMLRCRAVGGFAFEFFQPAELGAELLDRQREHPDGFVKFVSYFLTHAA